MNGNTPHARHGYCNGSCGCRGPICKPCREALEKEEKGFDNGGEVGIVKSAKRRAHVKKNPVS